MENNVQLFLLGDILEFKDRSQWEIIHVDFDKSIQQHFYEIENVQTGELKLEVESILNRNSYVARFSDQLDQKRKPLAKVYYIADYLQKKLLCGGMK